MNVRTILALMFLVSSCVTQRRCLEKYPIQADTVRIVLSKDTIIYRDTVIFIKIPADTVIRVDSVVIPCPESPGDYIPDTAIVETSRVIAKSWFTYPNIRLTVQEKDMIVFARLDSAISQAEHWRSEYEKIIQVKEIKQPPGLIYKIALWAWVGILIVILLIVVINITFRK